jgi:hypothetical protein
MDHVIDYGSARVCDEGVGLKLQVSVVLTCDLTWCGIQRRWSNSKRRPLHSLSSPHPLSSRCMCPSHPATGVVLQTLDKLAQTRPTKAGARSKSLLHFIVNLALDPSNPHPAARSIVDLPASLKGVQQASVRTPSGAKASRVPVNGRVFTIITIPQRSRNGLWNGVVVR